MGSTRRWFRVLIGALATILVASAVFTAPPAEGQLPSTGCTINQTVVPTVASQPECNALGAIYANLGGPTWAINTGWATATDPCTWFGVTCDLTGVTRLSLSQNNLAGTIPIQIINLFQLEQLDLSRNTITGSVPSLATLPEMIDLNLSRNALTGPIPAGLGSMTGLQRLILRDNSLSGPLPADVVTLSNLTALEVSNNNLSGPLPAGMGNLTNLTRLLLHVNSFSGPIPAELGNLSNLIVLQMQINEFSGSVPPELGNLNARRVELWRNFLSGDLTGVALGLSASGTASFRVSDGPGRNECFSVTNPLAEAWLTGIDPNWNEPIFTDVPAGVFFTDAATWAKCNGITNGTSVSTFSPTNVVSRAEWATLLWRFAGEPTGFTHTFTDVPPGAFFEEAVAWMNSTGVTTGTSPTTYSPADPVNRAQLATFLWRFEGRPTGFSHPFSDVVSPSFYEDAVAWMVTEGITTGTSPTTYSPDDALNRAQAITFLWRYAGSPAA